MIIHVYCSYCLSPVGFQHSVLRHPVSGGERDFRQLSPPEENAATRFITTAFDYGFITEVHGKIPGSESYVFLVKRYQHSYPEEHEDFGKDVYMNMAFEFSEFDDYKRFAASFKRKLEEDEAGLKREMADMIHPDYAVPDYALDIRRKKLDDFMSEMLEAQPDAQPGGPMETTAFYVLSAQRDYCEELKQLFGLDSPDYGVCRSQKNGKRYVYAKKKAPTGQPKLSIRLILILILSLIALLGIFMLSRSQKKEIPTQAAVSVPTPALPEAEETPPETTPIS